MPSVFKAGRHTRPPAGSFLGESGIGVQLSGMRLLACLIVAPQRGYVEPAILSYAISSFCPTSADGLHDIEHIDHISDEMRAVVKSEWPELAHKLPPQKPQG